MATAPIHLHPARLLRYANAAGDGAGAGDGAMPLMPRVMPDAERGCQGSEVQSCLQSDGPIRVLPPGWAAEPRCRAKGSVSVLPVTRQSLSTEEAGGHPEQPGGEVLCLHVPASSSRVLPPRLTCHHARLHLRVCFQWLNEPFYKVVIYWECIAYMTSIHPGHTPKLFFYA